MRYLATAIVAIFVSVGVASPAWASATLLPVTVELEAQASADAARSVASPEAAREWREDSDGSAADVRDVEADDDDDDGDVRCDVVGKATMALSGLPFPRTRVRAPRCQAQIDTSRFAKGTGLPRGPPVSPTL